jgi:hypothetical protein
MNMYGSPTKEEFYDNHYIIKVSNSFEQAWKIMIYAIHTCISITGS